MKFVYLDGQEVLIGDIVMIVNKYEGIVKSFVDNSTTALEWGLSANSSGVFVEQGLGLVLWSILDEDIKLIKRA